MARKIRSDCKLENAAKKIGVPENVFRHESGRKIRKDATISTIRKLDKKKK